MRTTLRATLRRACDQAAPRVFGTLGHPPARDQGVGDPELVADPRHDEPDQVVERPGPVIPAGHRRQDDRPGAGDGQPCSPGGSGSAGVSRGTRISLRRSLRWTSAARVIRFVVIPWAIDARVLMLHGMTTMPPVRNEPLAIPAEKSSWWW